MTRLRQVLEEADAFVTRMPTDKIGLLFLKKRKVVQPDPDRLQDYDTHAGAGPLTALDLETGRTLSHKMPSTPVPTLLENSTQNHRQ
jgi:hypothetical protein